MTMRQLLRRLLGRKPEPYVSQIRCGTPLLDPDVDPAYKAAVRRAYGLPPVPEESCRQEERRPDK